jgi:hypothetical protein
MSQVTQNQDFQPLPTFTQTSQSNESWVAVVTTREDGDGKSQSLQIISKK